MEIDTALAREYNTLYKLQDRFMMLAESARREAGAKSYWQGKRLVSDMPLADAEAILAADLAANIDDEYGYRQIRGHYSIGNIRHTVKGLQETREALAVSEAAIAKLQDKYTGWSRFFLVTSSKGHIHSSMTCRTCRDTTRYGWLPELSGQSEAEAVEAHGPALCTVCYPSAPVEWQGGWISKVQATKKAAS